MTEKEAKAELERVVNAVKNRNATCLENYIATGADLYNIKNSNLYMYIHTKDGGNYGSVYELFEDYFAISKSTVNNYIGVYRRYADQSSGLIKPHFKDYSFSQLREMLSLTDSQIAACTPSMTCEAIHDLKKKDKGKTKEDDFVPDPNFSLKIDFSKETYNKILARAKRRKKHMNELVIEIVELFFKDLKE